MTATLLGALFIFALRIVDVSIGTLRVLFVVRGRKWTAAGLGVIESTVFITAISSVFQDLDSPWRMAGYAAGFATGTLVGVALEQWIAVGQVLVRVISRNQDCAIRERLLAEGFGLTAVRGEGRDAEVLILFIVCERRRGDALLRIIRSLDPVAFVTTEPVSQAIGGFLRPTMATPAASVKK